MFYDDPRRKAVADSNARTIDREIKERSKQVVEEGQAYVSLMEHRGWQFLMERFIKPRLSRERFLQAEKDELPYVQHEMKVLTEMLEYIKSKITQAQLEAKLLEEL